MPVRCAPRRIVSIRKYNRTFCSTLKASAIISALHLITLNHLYNLKICSTKHFFSNKRGVQTTIKMKLEKEIGWNPQWHWAFQGDDSTFLGYFCKLTISSKNTNIFTVNGCYILFGPFRTILSVFVFVRAILSRCS